MLNKSFAKDLALSEVIVVIKNISNTHMRILIYVYILNFKFNMHNTQTLTHMVYV